MKIVIKSVVFVIIYLIATVAISYLRDGEEILAILGDRWYEYVLLLPVVIWFNYFFDKKSKKANKNKFYKDL